MSGVFRMGESIDPSVFDTLVALLVKKPLAMNPFRKRSGLGRSQAFGLVYQRCGKYAGSRHNFARMDLYRELMIIGRRILPLDFTYDAIQLNQNYQTQPHKDSGNRGESAIIGFGCYLNGLLRVENYDIDIKNRLVFFDGSKYTHSTTPFTGDRFSIVFHSHVDRHAVAPLYQIILQSDGKWGLQEDMLGVRRVYDKNGDIIHASDGIIPLKIKSSPYLRACIPEPTQPSIVITQPPLTPDYVVAIPSYKRAETLLAKTLPLLERYNIPKEKITVFVASEEEEKIYKDVIGDYKIVVGIKGMGNIRNFITSYYPEGTHIVNIDDDIKSFVEYDETLPRKEKPLENLKAVIDRGFEECQKSAAKLWGIYPVPNGRFMKPNVTTKLKYIIGSFWGCINSGIQVSLDDKEDFERSILYYERDKKVVRINYISPITQYYKEKGGMQEDRTKQRIEDSARFLAETYSTYCSLNTKKKSGIMEVRLKST